MSPATRAALTILLAAPPAASDAASVTYASYFGDGSRVTVCDVAHAPPNGLVVVGLNEGDALPVTPGALQYDPSGLFVARLNLTDGQIDWCTYLGTPAEGETIGIGSTGLPQVAVASDGSVWVSTSSAAGTLPMAAAIQGACAGESDPWVGRISADGSTLLSGTWMGGPGVEVVRDLAVAPDGDVVVAGSVQGGDMPQVNPVQAVPTHVDSSMDAFAFRLSSDAQVIRYSTHVGGGKLDEAISVAVDGDGWVHLAGVSYSHDFATLPVEEPRCSLVLPPDTGCSFGFLRVIAPHGGAYRLSRTFAAGVACVAADGAGRSYVVGHYLGVEPLVRPFAEPLTNAMSGWVARVLPSGDLDFASTHGEIGFGDAYCGLDEDLVLHVAGNTPRDLTVTSDAAQAERPQPRRFWTSALMRVDADDGALRYASWIGGDERTSEPVSSFAIQLSRGLCVVGGATAVVGTTPHDDFPTTPNAHQTALPLGADGLAMSAGFVHVTGSGQYVNAHEPSARDLNSSVPPLVVGRQGPTQVLVGWEETLGNKYGFYVGSMAALRRGEYQHRPVAQGCDVGAPPRLLPMPEHDAYFLVTEISPHEESSHGRDSFARERPRGPAPCR